MRALTFQDVKSVRCEEVPDPVLVEPTDAIVRVRLGAVCGSDLHVYRGNETGLDQGTVLGHEFLGDVVAVGSAVATLAPGVSVVSPFTTSCGECFYCERGLTARCERGELFGWVEKGRGLHGAQSELVRVPLADSTLVRVPDGARPEEALFCGDVLSTGFFCAESAGVGAGDVVCVLGAGPVGLMATIAAQELGAARVFTLDSVPERLALATGFGATGLDYTESSTREKILEATGGRGADAALECVGAPAATRLALDLVRPGGRVAAAGVHTEEHFAFAPGEAYDKNLTYVAGRCSARHFMQRTLALVAEQRYDLSRIVSHRVSIEEGARAYEMFDKRLDGCTKVVLELD